MFILTSAIPLFYQLLEAYRPVRSYTAPTSVVSPAPIISNVLGVTTIVTPQPIPKNVGGEGKVITIALLGDSMVDTLGSDLLALKLALQQYFPTTVFNLLNYGVGARDIEYGLFRLTNNYEYRGKNIPGLLSQNPDIVIVESFAYNNFGNTEEGINRHQQALESITKTIHNSLPNTKILIATSIAPNSIVFGQGIQDLQLSAFDRLEKTNTIKLYLQKTIDFANSKGYPLVDAYHLTLFGNDGSLEFINSTDHLHPSATGATLFSDLLADTIFKDKLLD
jgi:lysophospholipase L1-like esterase